MPQPMSETLRLTESGVYPFPNIHDAACGGVQNSIPKAISIIHVIACTVIQIILTKMKKKDGKSNNMLSRDSEDHYV